MGVSEGKAQMSQAASNDRPEHAPQVDPSHYDPGEYLDAGRMASIAHQFLSLHNKFPGASVLEVGVGSGLATQLLRKLGHAVTTLDFDGRLAPDLVGSVTDIPAADGAFDAFVCCQVLEHIPFEQVDRALKQLHRVSKKGGVLSVPTLRRRLLVGWHSWKSTRIRSLTLPSRLGKPFRTPDQHHWELEANVRTGDFMRKLVAAGFMVAQEFQPTECPYHHFFVVVKAGAGV